jgi:hypothetical protein
LALLDPVGKKLAKFEEKNNYLDFQVFKNVFVPRQKGYTPELII